MPNVRSAEPIAVLLGDVHLSDKCPSARSSEKDWFGVMAGYLDQVKQLVAMLGGVPVVCSGDLFHVYDPPPRLINFALDHLFTMYAVPGQHDMRNHVRSDMDCTAYGTMKRVGIVVDLEEGKPQPIEGCVLHGFPWGSEITPAPKERPFLGFHMAVCHCYVWTAESCHPEAPPDKHLAYTLKLLDGYDCALFGDNHKTIHHTSDSITLFNPGTFLRRRVDDIDHRPCVGILLSNGTVKKRYLDCSSDVIVRIEKKAEFDGGVVGFAEELKGVQSRTIDYREAVVLASDHPEVSSGARSLMLDSISQGEK